MEGLGIGSFVLLVIGIDIAIVCSWQRNKSILWATLAGILGWLYVAYFAFMRANEEAPPGPQSR